MLRRAMMAAAAGGGGGTSHAYWRIRITAAQSGAYVSIDEIEMRASVGGTDQCNGGTASADSAYSGSYAASNAFDNTAPSSYPWASAAGFPHWIKYAFAAPVSVAEVMIKANAAAYAGANEHPRDFTIEWSDDNSTWTVARTVTGQTGWSYSEERTFTVP